MQLSQPVPTSDSVGSSASDGAVPKQRRKWVELLVQPLSILILVSLLTMLIFDRPLIRGDGIAYLAWIDTLVRDRGINFNNEFDRLKPVNTYQISWDNRTKQWVDIFPFGVAVFQMPFYLLGRVSTHFDLFNKNPDYFLQMQGIELPYSFWMMIGANLMALATIILSWHIGQRFCGKWLAALIAWAFFLGTPLFYYSSITPLNSHNPGAFICVVFLWLLIERTHAFGLGDVTVAQTIEPGVTEKDRFGWLKWVLLGLSAGLMGLTRWQLVLIAVPAWSLLLWERRWRGMVIATIAAAITLLPLPLVWQKLFGSPFVVPYEAVNGQAFVTSSNHFFDVLLTLLHYSPILLISLVGIPFLWLINRKWTLVLTAIVVLQLGINGAALDWWAGDSFGMRRMSELYLLYVLLACVALGDPARRLAVSLRTQTERLWRVSRTLLRGALVVAVLYSFLYIFSFLSFTWTNPDGVFIADPEVMINYFIHQETRWEVIGIVFHTHLGPLAWHHPGP